MENKDFASTIVVDKSPEQAFEAIKNFRGWWSEDIEGETGKLGATFFYHYKDVHLCKIKLIEEVPGKKLVYQVVDNEFSFTKDKTEWVNTKLIFDLVAKGKQTELHFTHQGLVPEYECYNVCHDAWTGFIQKSLKNYINTGKGEPNPKDGTNQINAENIKKWRITDADKANSFTFSFETKHSPEDAFKTLEDPNKWWKGLYGETIKGNFEHVGDEFSFAAGDGAHYTEQKVVELIPNKKIVWLITKSKLTFLKDANEWTGTSVVITIANSGDKTKVVFKHEGLSPDVECYDQCSSAWLQYMGHLKEALN
ncbi:MAG: SRPBCC domain-containing protein [Bacteroidetes bacterium]|nr:SRPBCC domain-containing protein [Bacteroidota bacterium]